MSTRAFQPAAGVTRVTIGADPRIEITHGKPLHTSDLGLIAELEQHPHLRTAPVKTRTAAKTTRKRKPAAATTSTAAPAGEQA